MMQPYLDLLTHVQIQAKRIVDQHARIDNFMDALHFTRMRVVDEEKAGAMLQELHRIESEWVAFSGDPDQWDKVRACDYHDKWLGLLPDAQYEMSDFYVCTNPGTECRTLVPARQWDRKDPDQPEYAPNQRWYCPVCTTRYKAVFGKLLKWRIKDVHVYMKASIPDQVIWDYKCLVLNKQLDTSSAAKIMEQCPKGVELPEGAFTRVQNTQTECYTMGEQFWNSLPTWEWSDIFKANGVEIPPVDVMKKQNKDARKALKNGDTVEKVTPWEY